MKGLLLQVKGTVQGVGYRAFIKRSFDELPVTGYVRNLPDGSVEIYAEADEATLEEVRTLAKIGSPYADVSDITATEHPAVGRHFSFEITY